VTVEQIADTKQYCVNCGEPHWLRIEDPKRWLIQPCYVEDGYDEDGTMLIATLRHKWPLEICPTDCVCRRKTLAKTRTAR
jgi:hypothetical protein